MAEGALALPEDLGLLPDLGGEFFRVDEFYGDFMEEMLKEGAPAVFNGGQGSSTLPGTMPGPGTAGSAGARADGQACGSEGGSSGPSGSGGSGGRRGGKRVRNKTDRSVVLNRAAQGRYRERKKQRVQELEESVAKLQQELSTLRALQAQQAQAHGEASPPATPSVPAGDAPFGPAPGAAGAAQQAPSAGEVPLGLYVRSLEVHGAIVQQQKEAALLTAPGVPPPPPPPAYLEEREHTFERLEQAFGAKLHALHQLASRLDPLSAAAAAAGEPIRPLVLAPEVESALAAAMQEVVATCMAAVRAYGPDLRRFITSVEGYKSLNSSKWDDAERWRRVAAVVAVTPQQRAVLLQYREQLLAELGRIYQERAKLNEEAVQVLLSGAEDPELIRSAIPTRGGFFGLIGSFWDRVSFSDTKTDVLAQLRANVESEQRLWMAADAHVLGKLLTPWQAAWGAVTAFPEHCDALGLLNALHEQGEGSGSGGAQNGASS